MEKLVAEAIEKIASIDQEVLCTDQRWHGLRVFPYKTLDHTIRGAVIVLSDIDLRKRNTDLRRDVATYAGEFLRAIQHPLMILDAKWRVVWVNSSFHGVFQTVSEEVIGGHLSNVAPLTAAGPKLLELLSGTHVSGTPFRNHKIEGLSGPEKVSLSVSGSRLPVTLSESGLILLSLEGDPMVAPNGPSGQVVRDA
jgi:transcriptional regulator with PAS, ATPase and Fis domain